jgi:hypothetical protein
LEGGKVAEMLQFNGVKVFSGTTYTDRASLGDRVSNWMSTHPECSVVDVVVTQSSDDAYHCIAVSVFYRAA